MPAEPEPISDRFLAACEAMGFPRVDDYNARPGIGASYLQLSTRSGLRSDVGTAYLKPIQARPNLTVMRGALAQRVVIDGGRAVSVVATVAGRETVLDARREVIVACGAVRSPQLLELSGIGQPQVLEDHGIPVMSMSPHVGEHLQDHIMVRVCYRTSELSTVNAMLGRPWRLVGEAARFALARRGMFSSATLKSTLYAPSDPARTTPDLRIQIALVSATDRIPRSLNEGLDPGLRVPDRCLRAVSDLRRRDPRAVALAVGSTARATELSCVRRGSARAARRVEPGARARRHGAAALDHRGGDPAGDERPHARAAARLRNAHRADLLASDRHLPDGRAG
jgi:choline dehydrogenase-like flavoprotein